MAAPTNRRNPDGDKEFVGVMQPHHHSPVAVAVGILLRPDGSFLLTTRPTGKSWAGSWEFPGGKIEPGETVVDTLRRELREELAIEIGDAADDSRQIQVVEHTYPHAVVRLHVCVVSRWHGEPLAIEGQAFSWQSIWDDTTSVSPVLPATVPVIQSLRSIRETLCVRPAATNLSSSRDAADDHSARLHAGPYLSR